MRLYGACAVAATAFAASICLATPSHAITGVVRVVVAKAGLVLGAGGGRGTLTFRHRKYPFTVQGLSLGLTAGASISKLVGRADYINELSDFSGIYSVVGGGPRIGWRHRPRAAVKRQGCNDYLGGPQGGPRAVGKP
jgi:hypothetical protein